MAGTSDRLLEVGVVLQGGVGLAMERSKIDSAGRAEEESGSEETPLSGYCDRCDTYSEGLKEENGQYMCEDCFVEVESESEK